MSPLPSPLVPSRLSLSYVQNNSTMPLLPSLLYCTLHTHILLIPSFSLFQQWDTSYYARILLISSPSLFSNSEIPAIPLTIHISILCRISYSFFLNDGISAPCKSTDHITLLYTSILNFNSFNTTTFSYLFFFLFDDIIQLQILIWELKWWRLWPLISWPP